MIPLALSSEASLEAQGVCSLSGMDFREVQPGVLVNRDKWDGPGGLGLLEGPWGW